MEQTTIERIEKSPFYQELIEQERAELVGKRKAAAEALANIESDTENRIRGLIKTIAAAEKTASEIEKEAQEARGRVDALRAERTGAGAKAERERRAHSAFLLETADPRIDEAIEWFRNKFDELRGKDTFQQTHRGKFDLGAMQRKITTTSNNKAIVKALRYCRESIEKLEAMRLEPGLDQEALQTLAEGLPDPSMAFDEIQGLKPEKDPAHLPPWARVKSDNLHELEMDHLMKKADSLKRKRA